MQTTQPEDDRKLGWIERTLTNLELQRDGIAKDAWHTNAEATANPAVVLALEELTAPIIRFDNFYIELLPASGAKEDQPERLAARVLDRMASQSAADRQRLANTLGLELLGKFRACRPQLLLQSSLGGGSAQLGSHRQLFTA